jgi:hypothetical protein
LFFAGKRFRNAVNISQKNISSHPLLQNHHSRH